MGSGKQDEQPSDLLLKCLNSGRVDVLCSLLSQMKNKPDYHDNVDVLCCDEGTLLHRAVELDSADFVSALLSNGANPCVQNESGKTAYQMCKSDIVRNAFVQEALRAITSSNNGRLCQLISSGVSVDSIDSLQSRNTLLNWAADFSTADIVRFELSKTICRTLCEGGANVNLPNAKGETPLVTAVRRGNEQSVRQLLASGADPAVKTNKVSVVFQTFTDGITFHLPELCDELSQRSRWNMTGRLLLLAKFFQPNFSAIVLAIVTFSTERYTDGKPEVWSDLLWPQPKQIRIDSTSTGFSFPKDNRFVYGNAWIFKPSGNCIMDIFCRLKIYFCDASKGCPLRMMQAIQISAPLLSSVNLDLDYRGHKVLCSFMTADHDNSSLDGKITCGIFADGRPSGAYVLTIDCRGVEIIASDYCGVRYAFATLVQIIRLRKFASRHTLGVVSSNVNESTIRSNGRVPSLLQLATRLSYCKANFLFVNFEVRTTDRYQLPYTNRDLFHMMQVCEELFITLVPSLDTQSNYIEANTARDIIERFLDDFPLSKTAHFGANLSSILIANRNVLAAVQRRVPRIFLSSHVDERNAFLLSSVPSYVTLCIEGCFPFEVDRLLSPRVSIVLKFSTGDDGYLCAAPDSTAKKALLASRLSEKCNVLGTMVCDLSTGCEAMPPSLSYMSLLSTLGVAWNGTCDMKKFSFLQPAIAAHHILMDGDMTALFEQAATLGRVEHELTKVACGTWRPTFSNSPTSEGGEARISGFGQNVKGAISVFVEMILNPEALNLERLTPVIFKKARIELRRSLMALDAARKTLPYNFELALVLAEIKLVTELMVLTSRLGQALCIHGMKSIQAKGREEGFHYSPGRVGVAHLPLTMRTDFANSLLEIRSQFQHVWLSRAIPSTLPNALKMFDNLFRYNPENVNELAKCVQLMASENRYDRDIVLTILKLYQLNPDKFDEGIVRLVLLKTLMVLPRSDFALAKCLIDSNRLGSQELQRVLDLGSVLEACDFAVFWSLIKGEYKPRTDASEPFKVPQEIPRMIKAVAGFEEAVRAYACRVISVTFQNIDKSTLSRLLGDATDKQVAEYAKRFGWEERPDGVYFIANHEGTIRTRNIDEKLQFSSELFFHVVFVRSNSRIKPIKPVIRPVMVFT
uniref:Eukaryotic translation initiation factor 3 subunit K n=1 Tax=Angiostrongylus cantonensis TaxID=6313 RepID=A0A158P7Q3_ANGCA